MKKTLTQSLATVSFAALMLVACTEKKEEVKLNQLSEEEKKEGWTLLFDGKTTDGWHLYNQGKIPSSWIVQDSALYCKADTFGVAHGDLVTDNEFENFDLSFEWKIAEAGNSGVFINVQEKDSIPTAWASGPEYQLLERTHHDYAVTSKKWAGSLYNFTEQKTDAPIKPVDQWNHSRIKQQNGKIEFYLNDKLTAEQDFTSQAWKDSVAKSGFKTFPEFGKHTKGRIALQEWSKGIKFRNIKIKTL